MPPTYTRSWLAKQPALRTPDLDLHTAVRNFLLRGLVGAYVGFSSYLVIRSLAYHNRIIAAATERMNEVTTSDSWHTAANSIAELIAQTLSDDTTRGHRQCNRL